jgi:hypothetical protein
LPALGFERDQMWDSPVISSQIATELPSASIAAAASQPCPPALIATGGVQAPVCAATGARNVTAMQTNRAFVSIRIISPK